MTISKDLLDELLKGCERPEDLLGDAGLMKELKIRLMERILGAELTAHPLPGRVLRCNVPRGWAMRKATKRRLIVSVRADCSAGDRD
jgi:hypothetical protein